MHKENKKYKGPFQATSLLPLFVLNELIFLDPQDPPSLMR